MAATSAAMGCMGAHWKNAEAWKWERAVKSHCHFFHIWFNSLQSNWVCLLPLVKLYNTFPFSLFFPWHWGVFLKWSSVVVDVAQCHSSVSTTSQAVSYAGVIQQTVCLPCRAGWPVQMASQLSGLPNHQHDPQHRLVSFLMCTTTKVTVTFVAAIIVC